MAQSVVLYSSIELLISVGKGKKWNLTPSDWSNSGEEREETDVFAG